MPLLSICLLLISVCANIFTNATANAYFSEICQTANGESGKCKSIEKCPIFKMSSKLFKPEMMLLNSDIQNSVCGFDENTPLICCPRYTRYKRNDEINESEEEDEDESDEDEEIVTEPTVPTIPDIPQIDLTLPQVPSIPNMQFSMPTFPKLTYPKFPEFPKMRIKRNTNQLPTQPNCGFNNVTTNRLKRGFVKPGEYPWIAALGYKNENSKVPQWSCGGTLITFRHVITAAHCIRNDLNLVRLGDLNLFSDEDGAVPEDIGIQQIIIHKDFNNKTFTSDIAIIKLERRVTHPLVWPICLPVFEPLRSQSFLKYQPIVAGWTSKAFGDFAMQNLEQISVSVLENKFCVRAHGNVKKRAIIDKRVICTGSMSGDGNTCKDDTGRPLMLGKSENQNMRFYLIGIVSYRNRCAEVRYTELFTRITEYLDWIEDNIA